MTYDFEQDVERVACALCEADGANPYYLEPGDALGVDGKNNNGEPCHYYWREYAKKARAALETSEAVKSLKGKDAEMYYITVPEVLGACEGAELKYDSDIGEFGETYSVYFEGKGRRYYIASNLIEEVAKLLCNAQKMAEYIKSQQST